VAGQGPEFVIAGAAIHDVVAVAAIDEVATIAAEEGIVAVLTMQLVITVQPKDGIGACLSEYLIRCLTTGENLVAVRAGDQRHVIPPWRSADVAILFSTTGAMSLENRDNARLQGTRYST